MEKHRLKITLLALALALVMALSGCQQLVDGARNYLDANATSAPTSVATPTKEPTATPIASATPAPSDVPVVEPSVAPVTYSYPDDVVHGTVNFNDMEFVYPDVDAFIADIEALQTDIDAGLDRNECLTRYEALCDRYDQMDSLYSLAYIRYTIDISDEAMKKNQEDLSNDLTDIEWRLVDVGVSLVDDPTLSNAFSSDYVDSLRLADGLNDESIQSLVERETKLVSDYDELNTNFTIKVNGQEYDIDTALGNEDYNIRYQFSSEFNQRAGEIFLELVSIRNEMAQTLGYDNYAQYRYDCYDRDYTLEEAKALAADVKKYIVPLYEEMIFGHLQTYIFSFDLASVELDPSLAAIQSTLEKTFPELMEAWDYMIKYDLCSFEEGDNKLPGSYSTLIGQYNAPFLYTHWDGDAGTISTIFHEFGHYSNFYFNPESGWNTGGSLDLAEVDSQGLELMMLQYSSELYGAESSDAMRLSAILSAMYSLMSACMEDEFQQYVYANPNSTLEELNAEYYRLATEYNFVYLYGYDGTEWSFIPHHVQSPMYYISYGTSMLGALQVWEYSLDDYQGAHDIYMQISARPHYSYLREVLTNAGLKDPFSKGVVEELANTMRNYLSDMA
ncbi:MAG: M3 family metallopeptidase [Eubacteriales bacterium]|nr:M3 family metallopeptidase [Eubacteriales bacterium]